jgi:hypothetical protein
VPAVTHPIADLTDDFAGPEIDLTRWHLVGA